MKILVCILAELEIFDEIPIISGEVLKLFYEILLLNFTVELVNYIN